MKPILHISGAYAQWLVWYRGWNYARWYVTRRLLDAHQQPAFRYFEDTTRTSIYTPAERYERQRYFVNIRPTARDARNRTR